MNRLLSILLLFIVVSCESPYALERTVEDHYVIIYTGTESRKPMDPIDKNVFLLEAVAVYDEFRKRGVPAENIFVLYSDAKPDWSDEFLKNYDESFKKEFSSQYSNIASLKNLLKIEDKVDDKLKSNSVLHLVFNAHGRVDSAGFFMHSELDNRFMRADFLNEILEDNRGLTHLYVGSCYSGQLQKEVKEGIGVLVMGANDKGSCWLDRDNSFGRLYFSSLPDDLNILEYRQGFAKAKKAYEEWGQEKHNFIFNNYKTNRKDELGTLVWDPQIKELD